MSHDYQRVQWTPFKRVFDRWLLTGMFAYLLVFVVVSLVAPGLAVSLNPVQILIRAFGSLAFLMLTFVLCIGPLARLSDRFKPFLYNRRHLGVATFAVGFVHAVLVIFWYHGFGDINPMVSVLLSNPRYESLGGFPFESLGLLALVILFVMAATSHDFWNANLGPALWKTLHMLVYVAYVALVMHVVLGVIQFEKSPLYTFGLTGAVFTMATLHLGSALKFLRETRVHAVEGWLAAGNISDYVEGQARIVRPEHGEAIAVFLHEGALYGVSHVCRHQGGPLGEGRVIDGCITCPWHGFQYRLADGRSPEPFTERIATFETRVQSGRVYVLASGNEPGTEQAPANAEMDS